MLLARLINKFSWYGGFIFIDRSLWFMLIFLCFLVLILLNFREKRENIKILRNFLIFFSIIFFFSINFLYLYIFFELTLFPILVIIFVFGSQIEKISSSYYLVFYTVVCRFPWLFVFLFFFKKLVLGYLRVFFN